MNMRSFWIAAALAGCAAYAVETKTWTLADAPVFDKGKLTGLALSSDGRLSLAPAWKELYDPAVPHLWCAARDAAGNTFAAGADGKVFRIDPAGKASLLATLDGGAVYALSAGPNQDLLAAVSPGGKIYRIAPGGQSSVFSTLPVRYIWALVRTSAGALYAATGDPGQIHRIAPDGAATVLFDAADTHVRSMTLDARGNLIAGTEPGGVVLRVTPAGQGFVLYQTAKREVTAIAAAPDGSVYAAASGNRVPPTASVSTPVQMVQVQPAAPAQTQAQPPAAQPAAPRPAVAPPPAISVSSGSAGSEVYHIAPDGEPRRIWSSAVFTVYALALDPAGHPLIGTGNEGRVYRIDSPVIYTRLADAIPQQITAFASAPDGALIAVSANPGKVFQLGPRLEKSGSFESDVLDAGAFTYWGRLRHEGEVNGGAIRLDARSGNLESTEKNWSPWSPVDPAKGERIAAPPARYLAVRATLTASPSGATPVLTLIQAAYQEKNSAPAIERIEITEPNYRFSTSSSSLSASSTLTVPPVGQAPRPQPPASPATTTENASVTMTSEKGWIGARWRATDLNGDTLESKLEIRGAGEKQWKPLKDKLKEARYSWDSTSFADGRYLLRVTVDDAIDNYPGQQLSATAESPEFTIDNTPPQIEGLTARIEGSKILIRFHAADALTPLQSAEFSVNGGEWIAAPPSTRITDSLAHDYSVETIKGEGAEYTIAVKVTDERDNVSVRKVSLH